MRQEYKSMNMRGDTLELIARINDIIDDYVDQGFTLSVRQLYYQLVAKAVIENTERSYKRIASVINDARLCGMMDWDAIEDRNRDIAMLTRWRSGADIIRASRDSFHMDMWDNQSQRVFIIVEKAALAGVLDSVSREYDVPLLAARGYPSVSIVREMAMDHIYDPLAAGQFVTVLHLGDHDPSGIDMTRDLQERFEMFLGEDLAESFDLKRIALNRDQIDALKPPPNPAKTTDSRFSQYRKLHGSQSWELDALEPSYLVNLVTDEITQFIDDDAWAAARKSIEAVREQLAKTSRQFEKLGI